MLRRLAEALSAMRPGWREVHGEMGGHTAITLGCTACRHRTTVDVQAAGFSIDMNPMVPIAAEFTVNAQSPNAAVTITGGFGVNQSPCENAAEGCPFGDAVPNLAQKLMLNPKVIEASVEPPREQF